MRFFPLALLLFFFMAGAGAGTAAARGEKPRLHFDIKQVSATESAPAEVSVKAKALLEQIVAARPEFASAPGGKGVRAFDVVVNVDSFKRKLEPATKPGQTGQVLTISLGVQLVGTTPGGVLALAGSGQSTVMAEVGNNIRPREEEVTLDDALRDALTHAVSEAVTRLQKPLPKRPKK